MEGNAPEGAKGENIFISTALHCAQISVSNNFNRNTKVDTSFGILMPNIFIKITIFVDYYLLEYNCFLIVSESGSRVTSPLTAGFITKCSPPPLQQNGKDEREKYNVDSGDVLDAGIYNCNVLCVVIITKTNVAKLDRDCS